MRTRIALAALLSFAALLGACSNGDESPVPKQPPSGITRLAAQACACKTLECLTPLQTQLASVIGAQHSSGNTAAEAAEATAKVKACAAQLAAAAPQ